MASSIIKADRIVVDTLSQTVASVPANSYSDVTLNRVTNGTFMGATVKLGSTAQGIPVINNVTSTAIVVRIRNLSSNAAPPCGNSRRLA